MSGSPGSGLGGSAGSGLGSGPMPETPGQTAKRAAAAFAVILAMSGGLLFLWAVRKIVLWVVLGIMLAMTLEPGVKWLMRRGLRRWQAAGLLTVLVLVVFASLVAGLALPVVNQTRELINHLPDYTRNLFKPESLLHPLDVRFHIADRIRSISTTDILDVISGARTSIIHAFTKVLSFLAAVITTFTIATMLLMEGGRSWNAILRPLDEKQRETANRIGGHISATVGGYVRGNLFISVVSAVCAFLAMLILGVPYPVPLAIAVGLLDIVPLIGATMGAAVCIVVALTHGWPIALALTIYFIVYQQIENHFISIVVYSRAISMSPLTVLVAALAGATVGGIVGVLIAIPLAGAAVIVAEELIEQRAAKAAAQGGAGEVAAGGSESKGEAPG